jgi:hypothetical protein
MGHSKPSITMDIYAHLMDEENPEAGKKLDDTFFQSGSIMVAGRQQRRGKKLIKN